MSLPMTVIVCIIAALALIYFGFLLAKFFDKVYKDDASSKEVEKEPDNAAEEEIIVAETEKVTEEEEKTEEETQPSEPVEEAEEVTEETAEIEEEKEEPAEDEEEKEEPAEKPALAVGNVEDDSIRSSARHVPFAEKMLFAEKKYQRFYDSINNAFLSYRKVHARVSVSCASYRFGRQLIAKMTFRGKTLKLHLALDVNKFDEKIYYQRSLADKKAYAEVPFTVKVRSDRALNNALKLVAAVCEEYNVEAKTRYTAVDSIELLKK